MNTKTGSEIKNLSEYIDRGTTQPEASADRSVPHALSARQVAVDLDVEVSKGLSTEEAERRIGVEGSNALDRKPSRRWWHLLFDQFSSIVVWLLAAAASIALLTQNELEAAAILVVLLLNATIGFLIEWRADRALEALRKATHLKIRVRRDRGAEKIIDAERLAAGDIVILSAGDRVPADARIVEAANLRADESTLTGESVAVEKAAQFVPASTPLAERRSMLYLGTTVVAGSASAIVTVTGERTELGRIGKLVAESNETQTPLQKRLNNLGKQLVYIVLGIALIVFVAGFFRGDEIWLMLEVSISLAVAAVPEGLPAVTTLILALGVLRMARRNALVRKLSAVETLGSSTVICADKTGTLTENRMTVQEYQLANDRAIGISAGREFDSAGEPGVDPADENLVRLLRVSVLCNEAAVNAQKANGRERFLGDPTETALLEAAEAFGFGIEGERTDYDKLLELPFDSATKRMITVFRDPDGRDFAALKGAPGVTLGVCDKWIASDGRIVALDDTRREHFRRINEEMADRALRVLAFADKTFDDGFDLERAEGIDRNDYTFLGYIGMTDPPRAGVREAIQEARQAGIRVVMLTGDQINTARAVARELDLNDGGDDVFILHSRDLIDSNVETLAEAARRAHVFARVTPEDKMRIVKALQATGETVAVTGDGVNDAPALKHADIGIAMGMRGTEVAKEASDIVLTDDNFSTIVKAVEGGRTIYANIIKFVHLLFSDNLSEVFLIFGAIMAGLPLPLLPLQILWVNLVTDVFPALALAVEPASPETMKRKPRPPGEAILSKSFLMLILWKGLVYAAIVLGAYLWALDRYGEGAHARTVALLSLIAVQIANLFNCRSRSRSAFNRFFSNPFIFAAVAVSILLQVLAVYFAPLASVLDTSAPNAIDYAVIGGSFVLPIILIEITKAIFSRRTIDNG